MVPPARGRRPLPDRRHLVADRDRRPHDHAAAGRDAAGAGLVHAAVPGHRGGDRRRDRRRRAQRAGRHPGGQEAVAEHDPHDLGRPRALQEELLPAGAEGLLPGRRRRDPRRADAATSRSPAASTTCSTSRGHRMGTMEIESALVAHTDAGGRGGGGRPPRRHHRRGDLRLRRAEARAPDRRGGQEDRQRAAQLGRQGDRPDRQAEGHPLRRQPAEDALAARSCAACCARSPRARRSRRTRRRWRTRRSWSSWRSPTEDRPKDKWPRSAGPFA